MAMQNDDLLKAYLDMFRKTVKEWARGSAKYEERHKKRDFGHVMMSMSLFLKRYIGAEKHAEANPKLEHYLIINKYITRNDKGKFDVTEARYNEYRA